MGSIPEVLVRGLKSQLELQRAVETGTYRGGGARVLASIFELVITIELSPELHAAASIALTDLPNAHALQGDSRERLKALASERIPTFFRLDGHWSGGATGGGDDECPVLGELATIGSGHPHDCLFIDDARLFAASPPPPHDPTQWPSLLEVVDTVRHYRPDHHITVLADMIIAVPVEAKPLLDRFAHTPPPSREPRGRAISAHVARALRALKPS